MFESAADAIIEGNLPALEALLALDPDLVKARSTRPHQATLLHYLGANGVEDHRQKSPPNAPQIATALLSAAAEALLQRGAPITSIIEAAALGNLPLTESLLPQSSQTQSEQAFIYACLYGQTAIAAFLLDQGVDPAACTSMGQTGMHFAADGGHLETIQMLIQRKVPLHVKNQYGGTVLGQALWSAANEPKPSHPAIIEALAKAS